MRSMRARSLGVAAAGIALLVTACRQEQAARTKDTGNVGGSPPTVDTTTSSEPPGWDVRLGRLFAIPAPGGSSALLVFPAFTDAYSLDTVHFDLQGPAGTRLQLVRGGRLVASAQVVSVRLDHADDCTTWPSAQLHAEGGGVLPVDWTLGVQPDVAVLLTDSLAGRSSKDSTALTVALAKIASALPGDTASAFRGRPFVVRQANQFAAGAMSLVIAEITRTVSQEAMPLMEQLFVIARVDSSERSGLRAEYFQRTMGVEDETETTELVVVLRPPTGGLQALVSRDMGEGVRYGLLERLDGGTWRIRWMSAYAGC